MGPIEEHVKPKRRYDSRGRQAQARRNREAILDAGETGTLSVVESEGNGRMCLTLPEVLVSVVGIEKVLPTFDDLGVFLQLLPRSSAGERCVTPASTSGPGRSSRSWGRTERARAPA